MRISYKLGCNFDPDLVRVAAELNALNSSDSRIDEFYGSTRQDAWLAARPAYRIPDIDRQTLADYIALCHAKEIRFNYTLNAPYIGSKRFTSHNIKGIKAIVTDLLGVGIDTFTITTPLMAELVREASDTARIEVSTIAHVDTVTQIKYWYQTYRIGAICGNILKNRSIRFLQNSADYCRNTGICYNIIVNEFCGVGGTEPYGTHCIFRDSCYVCHSENETIDDDKLLNGYPMRRCVEARRICGTWLRSFFVRPEDVSRYHSIGINAFKITGRTGSTRHLTAVAEAYMKRSWNGNLLLLWKHLETIGAEDDMDAFAPQVHIENARLKGFIDKWFENPELECANEICGDSCRYCDDFAAQHDVFLSKR